MKLAMRDLRTTHWVATLACAAAQAFAQVPPQDAPYVPTPQAVVEAMLQLASVTARDVVYDLGSGDGRVVITAAKKFGARGVGVELDTHLIIQSEESARQAGVEPRVRFVHQDLFRIDLGEATVITMYLWPRMYDKLAPRLLKLRPGTRIVIYRWGFTDWKPDRRGGADEEAYYLYVVPAPLAGRWRVRTQLADGATREHMIEFRQRYQEIAVVARDASGAVSASEARLEGDRVRFVLNDGAIRQSFEGQVSGDVMTGVVRRDDAQAAAASWRAERVPAGETRG